MIQKVQGGRVNNNYNPKFGSAVIVRRTGIPVKRRGKVIPENSAVKFFSNVKEIFFEMFPKLDSEYKKIN